MYYKKKLGQNFLIDENIAKKEIEYCGISKDDIVRLTCNPITT